MQMGNLFRTMEEDIARILFNRVDGNHNGNIGDLVMQGGGITGYTLATDSGGNSVKEQAAAYMKASLGTQGVRLLLEKATETGRRHKTWKVPEKASRQESHWKRTTI